MDANEPRPFDFPIIDNEWIENLSSTRKADRMTAIENIKAGQRVQKNTHDSKVKHNRSEFVEGDEVLVHNIKKAKRFPGTKDAKKYLGPYMIEEVKPSYLVVAKTQIANNKITYPSIKKMSFSHGRKMAVSDEDRQIQEVQKIFQIPF
ncbi:hypothetical protein LOD99_2173 [Oopsacas minuta]|uniref:Uncharacterized protein n=1 Tax=Oopsacas minuta TaxID=111878 RepID=A0AAV7K2A3_9METZ|nr:hypothetical protein LOD99_2173 [Oopsacas minuta]